MAVIAFDTSSSHKIKTFLFNSIFKDHLCSERSEPECPTILSSEVLPLETLQPLPSTSPPPSQTTLRLQRNTFAQVHSPSHPGRRERRRSHTTYEAAEQVSEIHAALLTFHY